MTRFAFDAVVLDVQSDDGRVYVDMTVMEGNPAIFMTIEDLEYSMNVKISPEMLTTWVDHALLAVEAAKKQQ